LRRRKSRGPHAVSTVRDWWQRITRRFAAARLAFGHGTGCARDEAAWLVCSVLGIAFDDLDAALERPVKAALARHLEELADRRIASRAPLAYLLNEAWLNGHRFYVDERVIIPRSHIAGLLEGGLVPWIDSPGSVRRALDLCTGSGCLAILAALVFPLARIDASDISEDALAVARINVAAYRLEARVRLVQSDLFGALQGERYDLIVSNPPYVDARTLHTMPEEYRHEPTLALDGGEDGLAIATRILRQAADHLTDRGILVGEIGAHRAALEAAHPRLPLTWLETRAGGEQVFLIQREQLISTG
jgi:ribosomal protein L3 glutamine methyltransferase